MNTVNSPTHAVHQQKNAKTSRILPPYPPQPSHLPLLVKRACLHQMAFADFGHILALSRMGLPGATFSWLGLPGTSKRRRESLESSANSFAYGLCVELLLARPGFLESEA